MFMFETGATAAAPVGMFQPLFERFESPILMPELARLRLVSADPGGLTFDLGGGEWRLMRVVSDPSQDISR
jgi:hypothetical protein